MLTLKNLYMLLEGKKRLWFAFYGEFSTYLEAKHGDDGDIRLIAFCPIYL